MTRSAIYLYLTIGIGLLLVGFYATGNCPFKNTDVLSDTVFVAGWPVYLFADVIGGPMNFGDWLHLQACQGGVPAFRVPFLR